jgi:hypothetical protein
VAAGWKNSQQDSALVHGALFVAGDLYRWFKEAEGILPYVAIGDSDGCRTQQNHGRECYSAWVHQ